MTVDDLRLLLKNKPGDMKVLLGYLDSEDGNQFFELKNVSQANRTDIEYVYGDYYSESSSPQRKHTKTEEKVLILYDKNRIHFEVFEPCIVKS